MLTCPQCGSLITENQRVCAVCGQQLQATAGESTQQLPPPPPASSAPATAAFDDGDALPVATNIGAANPPIAQLRPFPYSPTNPFVGVMVGALIAIIGCIGLMAIFTLIIHSVSDDLIRPFLGYGFIKSNLFDYIAFAQHPSLVSLLPEASNTTTTEYDLPVTLFLLIPGFSLAFGGYIAASGDRSHQVRAMLLHAAAVGPIYGVIMAALITFFTTTKAYLYSPHINTSLPSLLLYGIVWGTLFGGLGGVIKLCGSQWRAATWAYLRGQSWSVASASATGALAAIGAGVLLSIPLVGFVFGSADTQQQLQNVLNFPQTNEIPIGIVLLGFFVLALPLAFGIMAFGSGVPIVLNSASLTNGGAPTRVGGTWIFNLPTGQHAYMLLALVPVVAYFIGGRITARMLGVASVRQRLLAAALMGVFSGIAMLLMALLGLNEILFSNQSAGASLGGIGPDVGASFLGSLAFGVIFGGLGSMLYRLPRPTVSSTSSRRAFSSLVQLRGFSAQTWLIIAVVVSISLGALAIAAATLGGGLSSSLPYRSLQNIIVIFGGIMLALPVLLFLLALMAAIAPPASDSLPVAPSSQQSDLQESAPPASRSLRVARSCILVSISVIIVVALFSRLPDLLAPHIRAAYPRVQAVISGVAPGAHVFAGESITFSALQSSGRDLSYMWTFDDGTMSNQATVTKIITPNTRSYQNPAIYQVFLSVADPLASPVGVYGIPVGTLLSAFQGHTSAIGTTLSLVTPPPVANFTYHSDGAGNIYFDASSSTGSHLTYHWDFGDPTNPNNTASATTTPLANHIYANHTTATYTVTLTVTDDHGQSATKAMQIVVPPTP